MEMVRLVNKGQSTFIDRYGNVQYSVEPGSEAFCPFDAACLWFGDPRARDTDRARDRTDEFERLRVKYGVYHDEHLFDGATPAVEVYTLDGRRIRTVVEDPHGEAEKINVTAPPTDYGETARQLADMQQQVNRLTAALGTLPPEQRDQVVAVASGDLDPGDVVKADTPPVRKAAGAPVDKPRTVKVTR